MESRPLKVMTTYGVITATLNAAAHVRTALASIWAQSTAPREVIVIDGGSTDGTLDAVAESVEVARRRGVRTPVRILRQSSPIGIAGAWNEAIAELSSDVVFLLNSDDSYEPHAARAVMRSFDEDPTADIVHARARFIRENGESLGICAPTWINRVGIQCRSVHCATFVRRDVYARVGGFDPAYSTTLDVDFIERCWRRGMKFRYVPEVVTNFRLGGISNSHRDRADWETLCIGLRHSRTKVPPLLAYFVRRGLMRPLGLAGFNLRLRAESGAPRPTPTPAMSARKPVSTAIAAGDAV
ncbi:MAG: glycosyltransferase [Phycisphaerae bacterium]|nr:glycosyltransferase [Phycisphaerae bacterium]